LRAMISRISRFAPAAIPAGCQGMSTKFSLLDLLRIP